MNVLLVDDEPSSWFAIRDFLTIEGLQAECAPATSARSASRRVEHKHNDINNPIDSAVPLTTRNHLRRTK
jgi:DNA-binding response OmpR family regulator